MAIVTEQEIADAIDQAIGQNRVMLFMKGTPDQPACGFSYRTVLALRDAGAEFSAMNILPDPRIRQVLSARSGWPTIPQLFIDGELVGGCDIVMELHGSGELGRMVAAERAQASEGSTATP
jgi:monothiol glutaredoxin